MPSITTVMVRKITYHIKPRGKHGILWVECTYAKHKRLRTSLHTTDPTEAERRAEKCILELYRDIPAESPIIGRTRVSDFLEQYRTWARTAKAKTTQATEESIIRNWLRHTEIEYLDDITPEAIDRYLAARRQEVGIETVKTSLRILKTVFGKAVYWRKIAINPFAQVPIPKAPPIEPGTQIPQKGHILSRDRVRRILDEVRRRYPKYADAITVLAWTGMRRSELLRLHMSQVDFGARTINMDKYRTKTGLPRLIPILPPVYAALHGKENFPFAHLKPDKISEKFDKAVRWLNKSDMPVGEATLSDLRASFEVYLIESGIQPKIAALILGHSERIADRYYLGVPIESVLRQLRVSDFSDTKSRQTRVKTIEIRRVMSR